MVGIALDNRIIRTFIEQEMHKTKGSCVMSMRYSEFPTIEEYIFKSMYYSKVMLLIPLENDDKPRVEDVRNIIKLCTQNTMSITFIAKYPGMFKRLKELLCNSDIKPVELTVRSIKAEYTKQIVLGMYFHYNRKTIPNGILEKILRKLRFSVNVDQLLDEIMSCTSVAALKEAITRKRKVYGSNFAPSLILGANKQDVAKYIQDNISSIPYMFTILENFVSDTIDLYPQYMAGEFRLNTAREYKTGEEKGKFNKYGTDPKLYLQVLEKRSYEYLYVLNKRIKDVTSKSGKILILGELLL